MSRRKRKHYPKTSPEGYGLRTAAAWMGRDRVVIGPSGKPLYGAAAVVYLHHKGHKRGAPYRITRYQPGESEWRRRYLSTRALRSR